jgi:hypothetical protein
MAFLARFFPFGGRAMVFWPTTSLRIPLVTFLCFVTFPWGYLLTLGAWWLAAQAFFQLPFFRAAAFILILAALSFLERLAILGALNM